MYYISIFKNVSQVTPFSQKLSTGSHLREKGKQDYKTRLPIASLTSPLVILLPVSLLQSHHLLLVFKHALVLSPQGLCTYFPLSPGCQSPTYLQSAATLRSLLECSLFNKAFQEHRPQHIFSPCLLIFPYLYLSLSNVQHEFLNYFLLIYCLFPPTRIEVP